MAIFDNEQDEVETLETWREFLDEFEETYWPMFKQRGYTKDTALTIWKLNQIANKIETIQEQLGCDG